MYNKWMVTCNQILSMVACCIIYLHSCRQPCTHLKIIYLSMHSLLRYLAVSILQLALLCFISPAKSYGQTGTNCYGKIEVAITKQKRPKKIYAKVTAFPCEDTALIRSIERSINSSIKFRNGAKIGKYNVIAAFVVAKDGTISDVKCLTDPGYGMGEEVLRAIKKSPKWIPAPANGRTVRVIKTKKPIV
jgi:Gram-negative bacterial TonB protein C-terminal